MKHIHSSCLRHPSETYTHTYTKSEKKSVREILVYLPGGFVLSGFNKNTEIPEKTRNFVDQCFQGANKTLSSSCLLQRRDALPIFSLGEISAVQKDSGESPAWKGATHTDSTSESVALVFISSKKLI